MIRKWSSIMAVMTLAAGVGLNTPIYADEGFNLSGIDSDQVAAPAAPSQSSIKQYANQLFHHAGDPVVGNPRGSVTLVEFVDYRCIHCANMASSVDRIINKNPNLRVVFKSLPLLGNDSVYAAKAAIAAKNQGKYFEFHEALLKSDKKLTQNDVMEIARSVGLDTNRLSSDINSASVNNLVQSSRQLARDLKLKGTPVFFIGKTNASGDISYFLGEVDTQQLQSAINKAS